MSDCRFGVSPVNYPDPDPELAMTMEQRSCLIHCRPHMLSKWRCRSQWWRFGKERQNNTVKIIPTHPSYRTRVRIEIRLEACNRI